MTINVFWYEPLQSVSFWRRFGGFLAYFVSINTVIYMNLYILVPCFLLKNRLGHYVLAAVLTNLVVIVFLSITQGLLFEVILPGKDPGRFATFINTFSGILTIGFVTAGSAAISLFTHWLRYNLRIDELESTTLQSELTFLKNQINPHFLFNMLNNANVLIKRNPEEASKVLFKLEDLLRYQINDSSRERVSLASDIRFLNDYLNLEKIRRDNFQFTLRQEGEVDSIWIQPLLFIPFVENANVLIKRNPEEASKVLFKLEDLLRYQINDSSRERVSLASDIRFLNDYLNLEKIRRDNFQFTLRQEGEVDSIWIQPLLFIPFVENAVKHSFDSEHSSYVHVFFKVDAHRLEFRCENSKPAVAVQQGKVGGIGLANIQRRLGLLYPEHYKLEQKEDENLYSVILSITL